MQKKKMDFKHYWLCSDCATERGGSFPDNHVCTVLPDQECPYCHDKKTLVPYVDFDWPGHDFRYARD